MLDENYKEMIDREIFSDTSFMDWLDEFSSKHPTFLDIDWLYTRDKEITKEDYANIKKLQFLYLGIDDYAYENNIRTTKDAMGEYYKLKYNASGFEIGASSDQEMSFFCSRSNQVDETFIDFFDILERKRVRSK